MLTLKLPGVADSFREPQANVQLGISVHVATHAGAREERGRHLAAARGAGGPRDARQGRQRRRCGPRCRHHAHRRRAHVQRHRLRRVRDPLGRAAPRGTECLGTLARGLDAGALQGPRCDAAARMGCGHRARRAVGVGHAFEALRKASLRGPLRGRHPLRARKLHGLAHHGYELGAPGAQLQGLLGILLDVPAEGPRALSRRALLLPAAGRNARGHRIHQGRQLLSRPHRGAHRAREQRRRRRHDDGRPRRAPGRLDRSDRGRVSRLPPARDAAQRARVSRR